ncbi:hypothetical protein KYI92_02340 [Pantoea allii]|uniref:Uncharacterized protein n=1 Tax=Pantoea allii TaxID=574096 RepID=A0ABS6V9W4_9GAMM|nr:hypothetical protein [Pantoea allii]MBW1212308.1 hypothetical protein [Pantoea allii]MBW1256054.1 hypothetical protein [Pantoea allii]MBW1265131.1 hypothetical protein [Pantoea allii]MBW1287248.1 hypothetical protein [Pantoea allii]
MNTLLTAIENVHIAQTELLTRWHNTLSILKQENELLLQQVDYLENRLALLEGKLLEERLKVSRSTML